jgi:hypothetical protein
MAALRIKACEERRGLCALGGRLHDRIFLRFLWGLATSVSAFEGLIHDLGKPLGPTAAA